MTQETLQEYKRIKRNVIKQKAVALLKQGFSLRETGKVVGKSHETIRTYWREYMKERKEVVDNTKNTSK